MNKIVIIINGQGGAGKDTVCDIAGKYYKTVNISSITPVKEIAAKAGWNGEKDNKSRKFLSDLKRLFTEYNDLCTRYAQEQYKEFLAGDSTVLFVHIREVDEIKKFAEQVIDCPCVTLLIRRRGDGDSVQLGNVSDDLVENYRYDYYYENNKPLSELETDFMVFFNSLLRTEKIG